MQTLGLQQQGQLEPLLPHLPRAVQWQEHRHQRQRGASQLVIAWNGSPHQKDVCNTFLLSKASVNQNYTAKITTEISVKLVNHRFCIFHQVIAESEPTPEPEEKDSRQGSSSAANEEKCTTSPSLKPVLDIHPQWSDCVASRVSFQHLSVFVGRPTPQEGEEAQEEEEEQEEPTQETGHGGVDHPHSHSDDPLHRRAAQGTIWGEIPRNRDALAGMVLLPLLSGQLR